MRKLISVLTPCLNESTNVRDCHLAVRRLFETALADYDYEHIFCDNASTDDTVDILRGLAREDRRVKVIVNARNFGPFRSAFNGLLSAGGDAVVVFLAADLQDPPELIVDLVAALPPDVGEFKLIDRVIVEALRGFDDYYPYIRGMIASCGFRSTGIDYTWVARRKGFSKNRWYHLVDQGLNGIISFSNVPMRICLATGFLLSGASMAYALIQLLINLVYFRELAPAGTATLIVALFFFSGVQLLFLGIVGEYVMAIHSQVRRRPVVIERERVNFEPEPAARRAPYEEHTA